MAAAFTCKKDRSIFAREAPRNLLAHPPPAPPASPFPKPPTLRYGHQVSDLSVFIANVFMLGYALESTVRGYQEVEVCEYPLNTWMVLESCLIFVLQIFTPLLLILPKTPNVLAPLLSGVLFLTQIVVLLFGWLWVFSPSNCPTSAPFLWNGAYWLVVVYSVAIPLEIVWYCLMYRRFFVQKRYDPIESLA